MATSLRASIWDVTEGRDVLFDDEALSMHGFCSCFGCCLIFKPCWAMDLTSIAVLQLRHLILPAEAVIHWRNHPGWDENINVAYNPRYIGSDSAVMHRTWPSVVLMYDSVLSSDAATLRPR